MWPFKKKSVDITYVKLKDRLSDESVKEMTEGLKQVGIYAYELNKTSVVPGTGLLLTNKPLSDSDLNAAREKLKDIELSAYSYTYHA